MVSPSRFIQIPNNSSLITYHPNHAWDSVSSLNPIFQVGDMGSPLSSFLAFTNDGSLSFSFNGSTISILVSYIPSANIVTQAAAESGNSSNLVNVPHCEVDGVTINMSIPSSPQNNWPLCSSGNLPDGQHTFIIDISNPVKAGYSIYFDYFSIAYPYRDLSGTFAHALLLRSVPNPVETVNLIPPLSGVIPEQSSVVPFSTVPMQSSTGPLTSFFSLTRSSSTSFSSIVDTSTPISSSPTTIATTTTATALLSASTVVVTFITSISTTTDTLTSVPSIIQSHSNGNNHQTLLIGSISGATGSTLLVAIIIILIWYRKRGLKKETVTPPVTLSNDTTIQTPAVKNFPHGLVMDFDENENSLQVVQRGRFESIQADHHDRTVTRLNFAETLIDTPQADHRRQLYPSLDIPSLPVTSFGMGLNEIWQAVRNEEPQQHLLQDARGDVIGRPLPILPPLTERYADSGVRLMERETLLYEGANSEGSMLSLKERSPPSYTRD